ncbi:hypothetical protein [Pseudomonas sp. TH15]|uniref:hypothetical protein n=1 Tax=Pseudomonas sp. TH15 TaxID=2796381 RepID=UPI001913F0E7|nr:hypothetical protein [Pseudomonas sp. TH15]MBK5512281.1 hypothetical protein [Pseudomonas sp. TH15]
MGEINHGLSEKLEDLKREICDLKAQLDQESGQRALAEDHLSSRIDELSELIVSRRAP